MRLKHMTAIILAFATVLGSVAYIQQNEVIETAAYTWGSRGDTVRTIQDKLKQGYYYSGAVDGIYGNQTLEAVKLFQKKNNLVADGIVGKQTMEALEIFEEESVQAFASNSRENDIWSLAKVINGEARGEGYIGQVAVGAVVINRVKHPSFPNSISGVIYQPGAFTAVKDGQANLEPSDSAVRAARDAINGLDPTNGAIYYWNPKTATSKWVLGMPVTVAIGNHNFGIR